MLRIFDNGRGIKPEERPSLFTPFFSTKKNGQGIGLTLIREILANHGFSFNLEMADDGQTVFWVDFRH
jgi:nitrogen-specific signal transduction histidine kinase